MTNKKFTYTKSEKLKSRKLLNQIFAEGKSLNAFPLKLTYRIQDVDGIGTAKVGVGVSSRYFKKAVNRNRVKRLLREAYRLNKYLLADLLPENKQINLFILFIGKDLAETNLIAEKLPMILQKLGNSFQNKI